MGREGRSSMTEDMLESGWRMVDGEREGREGSGFVV